MRDLKTLMTWDSIRDARQRLAREQGTIIKDWGGQFPIALVYPSSYYIGMSTLGIHAIYKLLNGYSNVICERAFWEGKSAGGKASPLSIESQRPLTDFAAIAFSITYELDYFNVVQVLKASGIPLYAADRDESYPLIIAGGPCVMANPMPLAPFFDCLCIGEAEPILPAMLPVLIETAGAERSEVLSALFNLPGIYVPQHPTGKPVVRQWAKNLDDFPVHSVIITPDTELGDMYLLEVERGCEWGCRFCLISNTYHPRRFRSLDSLVAQAEEGLHYRKRLGLVGPVVSDYPQFDELVGRLRQMGVEISVSSLRIKPLPSLLLGELVRGSARTVTLAPEAGSERLRRVIKKGITEDDILGAMHKVAEQGIKQVKLYFMLGLPSETDEDIEAIISLTLKCKAILEQKLGNCRITLTVSPFIPKAGTPFQWLPMEQLSTINHRLSLLKNKLPPKGIKIKTESVAWSEVQAALSRGDTKLAEVLADMDGVSLAGWRGAMEKYHLDIDDYAHRTWDINKPLPWLPILSGADPVHLEIELKRAMGKADAH
ncbi:MAG: radical SAM protein [Chloroflexota bacterium]